jgi:hypothetical protein
MTSTLAKLLEEPLLETNANRSKSMTQVKADSAMRDALSRNGDSVEILDDAGKLIGLAYSLKGIYVEEGVDPYDPEEVRAALADPRRYTTEELLKSLGLE